MVRCIILSAALAAAQFFFAQNKKLYYVKENDSMTTVRDANNAIVIPAYLDGDFREDKKVEVETDVVITYERFLKTKVYNRKGLFLFEPALFDYSVVFKEGYIPFKENGKYGLANKEGRKVIPAKYDYLAHPEDGVVFACYNCTFDRKADPEHPPLTGGTWLWMNTAGRVHYSLLYEQVANWPGLKEKWVRSYDNAEKIILSYFNDHQKFIQNKLKLDNSEVKFEVVYQPTVYMPYYHVKLYYSDGNKFLTGFDDDEFVNFYVSKDLKQYLVFFEEWQELNDGKENYTAVKKRYVDVDAWLK